MMTPVPVCPSCQEERARWLDTRPSQVLPRFGVAHGSGAAYDVSAAGLRDRGRASHEEWRQLVRFQRDLIAQVCREQRHVDASGTAPVVQLPLLSPPEFGRAA